MKYRLKKWYPSLPKSWKEEVIVVCKIEKSNRNRVFYRGKHHINQLSVYEVENNPEFWEKVKEPLFTTEDGVDIYEGDKTFWVDENLTMSKQAYLNNGQSECLHYFSTREKAQEYIDYNKPQYSTNDIEELLGQEKFSPNTWRKLYNIFNLKPNLKL